MKTQMSNKRYYNLDVLRILSMIMIVILHYCFHGYHLTNTNSIGYNTKALWIIYTFCYCSVDIFVLISGYFLCKSEFKIKKIINLWIEVFFYSVIIGIIFFVLKDARFSSVKTYLKCFFPFSSKAYWFFSIYAILYLISPYINKMINALSKDEFKKLLLLGGVLFFVANEFIPGTHLFDRTYGFGLLWFIYLYLFAAYIRIYDDIKINNKLLLFLYVISCLFLYLSRVFIMKYLNSTEIFSGQESLFYSYSSFPVFISAAALFLFFKNIKIKNYFSSFISLVSKSTFGVYLIHDNNLLRSFLYEKILKVSYYATKGFLVKSSAMLISVIVVFIVCIIIDFLRSKIFKIFNLN